MKSERGRSTRRRTAKAVKAKAGADSTTAKFERAASRKREPRYVLRLYVTGMTPNSTRAIENLRAICEEYLPDRYDLEIIDIYQHPVLMQGEQILAAPTLIKKLPEPLRHLVGDMSDRERVLIGLDLKHRWKDKSTYAESKSEPDPIEIR
jgi:circadian clock protein KaiB